MTTEGVREKIREYILKNFVFDEHSQFDDDQSLLKSGVVDSTGVLELIAFAEDEFHVHFEDNELVADNFDSVNRVAACVTRKLAPHAPHEEKSEK